MVQLVNTHTETVKRILGQYNHAMAFDRAGQKNPYMRPDRRVHPNHSRWWYHGYTPVHGRIIQRLSPNEVHVLRPVIHDFQHKLQHNLAKYGPVVVFGGSFIYGMMSIAEKWSVDAERSMRF